MRLLNFFIIPNGLYQVEYRTPEYMKDRITANWIRQTYATPLRTMHPQYMVGKPSDRLSPEQMKIIIWQRAYIETYRMEGRKHMSTTF